MVRFCVHISRQPPISVRQHLSPPHMDGEVLCVDTSLLHGKLLTRVHDERMTYGFG